jgi:DNA-binding CsgD family transcriptional regulator
MASERMGPSAAVADRGVFVGRAGELAFLGAAAEAARRSQPQVVLVEGEPGVGKSTLLARFAAGLTGAGVLRASGDEAELLLPYGVVGQVVASARGAGGRPGLLAAELTERVDPLAVGADLVMWLGLCCRGQQMALVLIDDLQWADRPSARALLFAVRRLHADPVLVVVAARPGELARLGEGWLRFLAGDHRAGRVRLGGLEPEEVTALGRALGAGELPRRAVSRLLAETGGNPLYCRAVLEDVVAAGADLGGETLPVPRSLAGTVLARAGVLSPPSRQLVEAAAVLGSHCDLAAVAALANLTDPVPALGEAVAAGILADEPGRATAGIGFSHLLVRRAVYEGLSPARRRGLHQRAAGLVDRDRALGHRVAAAVGADDGLAVELETAGRDARRHGWPGQAAAWLTQAAAVSSESAAADRRLLDALEILVTYGEVAQAEALAGRVAAPGPDARRSWLLGTLDFLAGRGAAAEARLREAWQAHDPAGDPAVGGGAATRMAALCLLTCRFPEAIEWGERAAGGTAPAAMRHRALAVLAIALSAEGRGPEGLARLAFLPAAPAEVPRRDTDTLVMRGIARFAAEDLAGAVTDLSAAAARLRAGVPLRGPSLCLGYLALAEWRLGAWDDAVVHAELAVSLARDADRASEFSFVHFAAAVVPALRGDWEVASAHVRLATQAARAASDQWTIGAAATARAFLAMARGDLEGVIGAVAAVRATDKAQLAGLLRRFDWQVLEIDALIGLGRLGEAEASLAEMEAELPPAEPPSVLVAAARLRGDLSAAAGHPDAAASAFETAWRRARGLRVPLALAQLEISDARRLLAAGQPQQAVARLRSARQRLITLGARPYVEICDRELAAAGAPAGTQVMPTLPGLTPAEQAVARLVAAGRSNRQTAAELYVSVKTVEFHLGHIFDKLGIRSRKDLIARFGAPPPPPARNLGPY